MWIDFVVMGPVVAFALWLYWFSRPRVCVRRIRWLDRAVLMATPVSVIGCIVVFHRVSEVEGMGLNVMAVASAYLLASAILGLGWVGRVCIARTAG